MTYLPKALYLNRDAMAADIAAIPAAGFRPNPNTGKVWAPIGVYWHNTATPSISMFNGWPLRTQMAWGDSLNSYYRGLGWHAGPHACGTHKGYAVKLGDWQADGIHCTCGNDDHFGVETVLNAVPGGDDPTKGDGLLAMQSSANIIAALCKRFAWAPRQVIKFHRSCAADHHACPGVLVSDDFAFRLVETRLAELNGGAAAPAPPATVEPIPAWPPVGSAFFAHAARCFNAWKALGVSNPFALGMLANGEAECSLDVTQIGDNHEAHGLFQWHDDRITLMRAAAPAGAGIDITTAAKIEDHVKAAWWELNATETKARDAVAAATTAFDAAVACCSLYERAGAAAAAQRRGAMAERWATFFSSDAGRQLLASNPAQ